MLCKLVATFFRILMAHGCILMAVQYDIQKLTLRSQGSLQLLDFFVSQPVGRGFEPLLRHTFFCDKRVAENIPVLSGRFVLVANFTLHYFVNNIYYKLLLYSILRLVFAVCCYQQQAVTYVLNF